MGSCTCVVRYASRESLRNEHLTSKSPVSGQRIVLTHSCLYTVIFRMHKLHYVKCRVNKISAFHWTLYYSSTHNQRNLNYLILLMSCIKVYFKQCCMYRQDKNNKAAIVITTVYILSFNQEYATI